MIKREISSILKEMACSFLAIALMGPRQCGKPTLAKVFGIEGATTLDGAAFSSDNVCIEFGKPEDGKVKIKAAPKDSSAKSFFMRVKVK